MHTYLQTLEIVEKFMKDSGIRKFCSTSCKGACCMGCDYQGDRGCTQEPRNLLCSITMCSLLHSTWRDSTQNPYAGFITNTKLDLKDLNKYKQACSYLLKKVFDIKRSLLTPNENGEVSYELTGTLRTPFPTELLNKPLFNERVLNKLTRINTCKLNSRLSKVHHFYGD